MDDETPTFNTWKNQEINKKKHMSWRKLIEHHPNTRTPYGLPKVHKLKFPMGCIISRTVSRNISQNIYPTTRYNYVLINSLKADIKDKCMASSSKKIYFTNDSINIL